MSRLRAFVFGSWAAVPARAGEVAGPVASDRARAVAGLGVRLLEPDLGKRGASPRRARSTDR